MKAKRRKIVNTLAISLIMKHDTLLKIGYMKSRVDIAFGINS